jgi:hypothetical protein
VERVVELERYLDLGYIIYVDMIYYICPRMADETEETGEERKGKRLVQRGTAFLLQQVGDAYIIYPIFAVEREQWND